jgi:hypothetical protein
VIDVQDVRRVQWTFGVHALLVTILLALQARHYPAFMVEWATLWLCAIGVPAAAAWMGVRRIRRTPVASAVMRQFLLVPLFVAMALIACFFDLFTRISRL